MDREDAGKVIGERLKPSARKWALCAVIALTIIFTIIGYQFYQKLIAPEFETASSENMALPLPDKPSIAVLAFDNMSGNPEQDYFSDGITEDIITDLAKISGLFVISSHSSFRFKDKIVDVQEVGKALGVRFLLDGSIRKDGNRVRINVQLIDTINGSHLWSERYDRELKNVFNLQNEILSEIVTALDVKLVEGEQAKFYRKATDNPQAYDYFAKGISFFRQFKQEANSLARQHLLNAIKLDPEYAEAMGLLGTTHWADARYGWSNSRSQSLQKGKHLAKKALEIDNHSYLALSALSSIYLLERDIDRSLEYRQKAFTVNPNSADSNAMMGWTLSLVGREDEALSYMKTAMKLSPFYPYWYLATLCDIYRLAGRYEDAISTAKAIIDLNLDQVYEPGRLYLSAVLIELGREREARELALEHIKKRPSFSLKRFEKSRMYKDFRVTEKLIGQLRMAGFPE